MSFVRDSIPHIRLSNLALCMLVKGCYLSPYFNVDDLRLSVHCLSVLSSALGVSETVAFLLSGDGRNPLLMLSVGVWVWPFAFSTMRRRLPEYSGKEPV